MTIKITYTQAKRLNLSSTNIPSIVVPPRGTVYNNRGTAVSTIQSKANYAIHSKTK